jgi:hypothetical protein
MKRFFYTEETDQNWPLGASGIKEGKLENGLLSEN